MVKIHRAIPPVLAAVVALIGLAAPAHAAQIRPLIQGVVVDQGGRYVDDVQVLAVRPDGSVAASALSYASDRPDGPQHGYFFLAVGARGTYTVTLAKDGYVAADLGSHDVARRGVISLGEVTLRKRLVSSSTSVSLDDSSVRPGQRAEVTVGVETDATSRPSGPVTLYVDGRKQDTRTLRGSHRGALDFTLPRLDSGEHRVKATWAGSDFVKTSTSRVVTLQVRRAAHRAVPRRAWVPGERLLRLTP